MSTRLSRAEVRAFDEHAIEQLGIPSVVLMENAGQAAARWLASTGIHGPVVIACGKGNNGGDGLVIARHLATWGFQPIVQLFADPRQLSRDGAIQWNIVQKINLATQIWPDANIDEERIATTYRGAAWIVDALFGTGLTGPLRDPFDRVVRLINDSKARVLAIDIPTGLDCDTGAPLGPTVRAECTITFVALKRGFANPASTEFTGKVHVAELGVPFLPSDRP